MLFLYNRKTEEEKYKSREDATNQLVQRRSLEAERYLKVYNVVMNDYNNYNLVLDTTSLSIKEVCEILYNEACEYKKGNYKNKILASPKNIYPAKKVSDEYKESDSDIVDIICFNDVMYAIDGNEKLKAANAQGKKIIEVNLIEGNKENISITLNDLYEWEKENEFNYAYYPISE